jgi:hypothetical protein
MAADGYVEVKPVKGTLQPGQLVVVGNGQTASNDVPAKQL